MNLPPEPPFGRSGGPGMLDEPSLSRQWVARRLQRALSVERLGAPLRDGLARVGGEQGRTLSHHGRCAAQRAHKLESLIRAVGSEPYGAWGLGEPLSRATGALVGRTSLVITRRIATLMAEHTLSEYRALEALVHEAPGVSPSLSDAVAPLSAESARELQELSHSGDTPVRS